MRGGAPSKMVPQSAVYKSCDRELPVLHLWFCLMSAMMEMFRCLLGVVLVCGISAQQHWLQPQKHPLMPTFQKPQQQSKVPPPAAPFHECVLEEAEKIQCGAPGITVDQCQDISCCFDGHLCYYGKAVTVQCTRDGQFVVVVAREATWPPLDVNSVSLLEPNEAFCGPVDGTSAFAIFQFPVTACGTTLKQNDEGYVVYENHMVSSYEVGIGPKGSITRDSHFELLFQCRYLGTTVEALVLEVNPVPPPMSVAAAGPLRVELRLGKGQCVSKGCLDDVAAYSSFYSSSDYPISKVLREPVYVEVRLLGRSDPNIVLNLERCWATSNPNPQSVPQWDLLVDGCPYPDDRYLTTVIPLDGSSGLEYPTHYKRFVSRMFSFVNSDTFAPQKDTGPVSAFVAKWHRHTRLSKVDHVLLTSRCSFIVPQLYAIQAGKTPANSNATGKEEPQWRRFPSATGSWCQVVK